MPAPLPKSFTIKTTRLLLRIPTAADIPRVFSATRYAGFNDGMQWEPPTSIDELWAPLQRGLKAWENNEAYGFTITRRENDELLGRISIRLTEEEHVWNVGFWTHPEGQRQGIMPEALSAILDFSFHHLKANRVEAAYAVWNSASEKVLHRAGFNFVRRIEQGLFKGGEWVPENLVAITPEKWNTKD